MDEYLADIDRAYSQGYALGMAHGLERAAQYVERTATLATEDIGHARRLMDLLQRLPDSILELAKRKREGM